MKHWLNKLVHRIAPQTGDLRISHVKGLQDGRTLKKTVGQVLRESTQKFPKNYALHSYDQNVSFTYEQIYDKARQLASGFVGIGLKPKDRIAIYAYNNYQWYLVQLAAALADLILVNINPAYQSEDLAYTLNKVNCKILIMASKFKIIDYRKVIHELIPDLETASSNHICSKRLPDLERIYKFDNEKVPGYHNFDELFAPIRNLPEAKPEDPVNIQYTSGTTGQPKACVLSHLNIVNNGYQIGQNIKYTEKDSICLPVPFYHCFGMVMGNMAALTRAATAVVVCEGFDAKKSLEAVSKYGCTSLYGVPTMFLSYLQQYNKKKFHYNVSKLRTGIMAGALCPEILMNRVMDEFGMKDITICYGMTQTSPVSFQTHPNDTVQQKTQTVGRILPRLEAKIVDENGETVKIGQSGEIWVKGQSVMIGYWGDEQATKKSIVDGWMKTGDTGEMDYKGYVTIVGRVKDMVIRGGENIYPKEIEEYLRKMPGIHDIQVIGIPDPKYGEETVAMIKLQQGANIQNSDIYNFCINKIAHYKIPKYAKFVDHFPTTVSGKHQKFKMRDEVIKEMKQHPERFLNYQVRHH